MLCEVLPQDTSQNSANPALSFKVPKALSFSRMWRVFSVTLKNYEYKYYATVSCLPSELVESTAYIFDSYLGRNGPRVSSLEVRRMLGNSLSVYLNQHTRTKAGAIQTCRLLLVSGSGVIWVICNLVANCIEMYIALWGKQSAWLRCLAQEILTAKCKYT